jgi:hypothetical protein
MTQNKDAYSRIRDAMGQIGGTKDSGPEVIDTGNNWVIVSDSGRTVKRFPRTPEGKQKAEEYLKANRTKNEMWDSAPCALTRARDAIMKITKDVDPRLGTASSNWPNPLNFKGERYEMAARPGNELPGGEDTKIYEIDDEDEISSSTPKRIQVTKRGDVYKD